MAETSKETANLAVCTSHFSPISEKERLRDILLEEEQQQLEDQDQESVKDNFDVLANGHDEITKALTRMAVSTRFPFKVLGGVRSLTAHLRPDYQMPSSLSGPLAKVFCDEKKMLKNLFERMEQMFCLSIDTWTSIHGFHYMCLTVHYIDDNWSPCKKLLRFEPFALSESRNPHPLLVDESRRDIGEIVQKCLDEWGIDRIFAVVVGTLSANEMAIDYLKDGYSAKEGRMFSSKFMHMTCVVHIVNLLVIKVLKLRNFAVSVERIRGMVRYVKVRPIKLEKFKECMAMEGVADKPKLYLDWYTRWDTTYFMLDVALKYEKVWKRYLKEDPDIAVDLSDEGGVPETGDWDKVRVLHNFLKCFYDLTKKISTSKCAISLVYHEIVAIHSALKKWNESDNPNMKIVASKVQEMYDKHWGKPEMINKLIYIATVLDPRFKLGYVQFTMEHLHEKVELVERMKGELKEALYDLFNEYGKKLAPTVEKGTGIGPSGRMLPETSSDEKNGDSTWVVTMELMNQYSMSGDKAKSELDIYLLEAREKCDPKFDISLWWEGNSTRFPILYQMARDVFTTPASISPESAFLIKGQVLDEDMSLLGDHTREVLLCARDWLTGSFLIPDDVDFEDQEEFDMELEADPHSMAVAAYCSDDAIGDDDNDAIGDDDNDDQDCNFDDDGDEDDGYFGCDCDEEDYETDDVVSKRRRSSS